MTSDATVVTEFLDLRSAARLEILAPLANAISKATESMECRMPTRKRDNDNVCALNSQKNYVSFYIAEETHAACADLLKGLNCGKSWIRFLRSEQLPLAAVSKLVKARLKLAGPQKC